MLFSVYGIPTYGLAQLAALLLFAVLVVVLFRRSGLSLLHAVAVIVLYILCNFLVAKLLFDYVKAGGRHTLFMHPALAHFMEGGFWGWPIAFLPAVLAYPLALGVRDRIGFYRGIALALPPVVAVQKVACFLAGCCHGRPTSLPWGVTFPADSLCATPGVPLHPLQLYDALLALGIGVVLLVVDRTGGERGQALLFPLFVALFGLARFATEFLRPEAAAGLLTSQWLELGAVLAVFALLLFGRRLWYRLLRAPQPAVPGEAPP